MPVWVSKFSPLEQAQPLKLLLLKLRLRLRLLRQPLARRRRSKEGVQVAVGAAIPLLL
jgi:hypothetical protein